MITFISILFITGYVFGSIPVGYLVAKKYGVNIFNEGSKNPGSTNVGRVVGRKAGLTVFVLDITKTLIGILLMQVLLYNGFFDKMLNIASFDRMRYFDVVTFVVGFGAILGHNFPFTTKFHGGKGITCTVAVICFFSPIYSVFLYAFFRTVKKVSGYVSAASITTLMVLFLSALVLYINNIHPFNREYSKYVVILIFLMAVSGILRHTSNIKRLLNGTENREFKNK